MKKFLFILIVSCSLVLVGCKNSSTVVDGAPQISAIKIKGTPKGSSSLIITIRQKSVIQTDETLSVRNYSVDFVDGIILSGEVCVKKDQKYLGCRSFQDMMHTREFQSSVMRAQIRFIEIYDNEVTPERLKELESQAEVIYFVPPVADQPPVNQTSPHLNKV